MPLRQGVYAGARDPTMRSRKARHAYGFNKPVTCMRQFKAPCARQQVAMGVGADPFCGCRLEGRNPLPASLQGGRQKGPGTYRGPVSSTYFYLLTVQGACVPNFPSLAEVRVRAPSLSSDGRPVGRQHPCRGFPRAPCPGYLKPLGSRVPTRCPPAMIN